MSNVFSLTLFSSLLLLGSHFRSYVDGLIAVIASDTQTFTFEISTGNPTQIGEGDLHDTKYDRFARDIVLDDFGTVASESSRYTLTLYPSKKMLEEFRTARPLALSIGFVAVIFVCTAIFILYDFAMRYEVTQRSRILQVKRKFVR